MSFLIPDINTFFLLHTHFFSLLVYHVPILSCNPTVYTLCTVSTWGSVYVRQNQCRSCNQSPADSDTLLLATGELTGKMMTAFGQSQNIQQLVDKPLVWPLVVKQQRKSDVLFYIQFRDQIK